MRQLRNHTPELNAPDWRRAMTAGVLALGMTASGVADACALDALLRLPLERLLDLRIGAPCAPQDASTRPLHNPAAPRGHRAK